MDQRFVALAAQVVEVAEPQVHPAGSVKTAIGKLYADHPNEPDIVERTLLDLGPIAVAPGEPAEQTIVLPDAWFR